jgi:hypothetical protein
MSYPPLPDCLDCQAHGECICWTDADAAEFARETAVDICDPDGCMTLDCQHGNCTDCIIGREEITAEISERWLRDTVEHDLPPADFR